MRFADSECNKTHFIILAHPRSGSTMLSSALACHTQTVMYGEVFNDDDETRQNDFPGDLRKKRDDGSGFSVTRGADPYYPRRDAADVLARSVFYPRWRIAPMAIGIKIFYEHARSTLPEKKAWEFLQESIHVKVIHLRRGNLLHAYLSLKKAFATNQWTSSGENSSGPNTILSISSDECMNWCQEILSWRAWAERTFVNHRVMNLAYEQDLLETPAATFEQVQEFLDIRLEKIEPRTKRQRRDSYALDFPNYNEVAQFLTKKLPQALELAPISHE